jgi:hypothetical protein
VTARPPRRLDELAGVVVGRGHVAYSGASGLAAASRHYAATDEDGVADILDLVL